uniref:Uncharacterized protein n=1 Tax=Plectus sambesii TaxID=2011161 RepID=A0A914VLX3_9BILA
MLIFLFAAIVGQTDSKNEEEPTVSEKSKYYVTAEDAASTQVVFYIVCFVAATFWGGVALVGYRKFDWQALASALVFFFGPFGCCCAFYMQTRTEKMARQRGGVPLMKV